VDAWLGGGVWAAETVLIAAAAMTDGDSLLGDSPLLRTAETVGSVLYFAMQCYYVVRVVTLLRRMRRSLHDYYDYDISQRIEWMQVSIWVLAVLSLFVPAFIFAPGRWLMGFAVVFFYGTWYFVDSFCDYVKGSMPRKVAESLTPDPSPNSLTPGPSRKERGVDSSADNNSADKGNHSPLLARGAGGEAFVGEASALLRGTTNESVTLQISSLLFIEAVGNYVKVCHLRNGQVRTDMLRATMKQMEETLKGYPMIVRCHRAFLVNLGQVEQIISHSGSTQLQIKHCHESLPVSRSNMAHIKAAIKQG